MKSELELLRTLAEAEDDVKNGRVAPIQDSFDDLCEILMERKIIKGRLKFIKYNLQESLIRSIQS